MASIGMGGWEGVGRVCGGGGWGIAGGGLYLPLGHRQQCCVFNNDKIWLNSQDKSR